jgi:hypothetical protein
MDRPSSRLNVCGPFKGVDRVILIPGSQTVDIRNIDICKNIGAAEGAVSAAVTFQKH